MVMKLDLRKAGEKPERSGACLCGFSDSNHWQVLNYSKKHEAFNAYDSQNDSDNSIKVDYWAELPIWVNKEGE